MTFIHALQVASILSGILVGIQLQANNERALIHYSPAHDSQKSQDKFVQKKQLKKRAKHIAQYKEEFVMPAWDKFTDALARVSKEYKEQNTEELHKAQLALMVAHEDYTAAREQYENIKGSIKPSDTNNNLGATAQRELSRSDSDQSNPSTLLTAESTSNSTSPTDSEKS